MDHMKDESKNMWMIKGGSLWDHWIVRCIQKQNICDALKFSKNTEKKNVNNFLTK